MSHQYEHDDYTHPDVYEIGPAQGWAEKETDPTRIDWPERRARAVIPFEVVDGRPVNPCEKTRVRHGRKELGYWGENLMADALVTIGFLGTRYLLMVERDDAEPSWAAPGGGIEPGESGLHAGIRELREETDLSLLPGDVARVMPPRYVPDPRASGEAWAVTVPVAIDLGDRGVLPDVNGADDARRAEWMHADDYDCLVLDLASRFGGEVFAAHVAMLRDFLGTPS